MTREEILAMKPGEDLDALIELHLFDKTRSMYFKPTKYSTSISAAWEVVEKIKQEMQDVTIHDDPYQGATATISLMSVGKAPTVPHAICIASLLAVMDA